jgi:hypothetical protein
MALTAEQWKELARRYEAGESGWSLSKEWKVSTQRIYEKLARMGVERRKATAPKGNKNWLMGRPRVLRCVVCDYPFSGPHHPKSVDSVGRKGNYRTVALCPNHHKFANEVQRMIFQGLEDHDIRAFAAEYFDPQFTIQLLDFLIDEQRHGKPVSMNRQERLRKQLDVRDQLIRQRRAEGVSLAALGLEFGLCQTQIRVICRKTRERVHA